MGNTLILNYKILIQIARRLKYEKAVREVVLQAPIFYQFKQIKTEAQLCLNNASINRPFSLDVHLSNA